MLVQFKKISQACFILFFPIALSGCETFHYYSQAINGQCRILANRRPISNILSDPDSPDDLREKLNFILEVRQFAKNELKLPVNNNYLTYVDLKRPFVVWNVFAAPEFSLKPKTWCYPVVGCAAYRGYFAEKDALQYAEALIKQGYDVYIGGVTAYSTLGWFDDPVLNTFIRFSEAHAAALIFHELAHQILYVADDTVFNESFATSVEQEGLQRWQQTSARPRIYNDYFRHYLRRQQFVGLIMHYRQMLELLYQTDTSPSDKRDKKASIFSDLRNEFSHLKTSRIDLSVYDEWVNQPLNNAKIGSVVAYHNFVPAFHKMLTETDGDVSKFYEACRELGKKKKDERHRILNNYLSLEN